MAPWLLFRCHLAAATRTGRGCKPCHLDRPITIGIRGPDDTNQAGQFVAGVKVESYPVFATALDLTNERVHSETWRGAKWTADRIFRVRWFEELALAPVTSVSEFTDELAVAL